MSGQVIDPNQSVGPQQSQPSQATDSQKSIELTIKYIRNGQIDALTNELTLVPLDQLSEEATDTLLALFLRVAMRFNRPEVLPAIFEAWDQVYPEIQKVPLFSMLFRSRRFPDDIIQFMVRSTPTKTFAEVIDDLLDADSDEATQYGCSRAVAMYGQQQLVTYEFCLNEARVKENIAIVNFMEEKIREVTPYQDIPAWVKNYSEDPLVPEEVLINVRIEPSSFELPTDSEIVTLLTEGLYMQGIGIEDEIAAQLKLGEMLQDMTRQDKLTLIEPFITNETRAELAQNTELFRIFGPANPDLDADLTEEGPNTSYGGGRMFLYNAYDYNEDDELEYWFVGSCDLCLKRIRYYWHAVRLPVPTGGWKGCYCSWDCAIGDIDQPNEQGILEPNLALHLMSEGFEKKVLEIGIQERLPTD